MKGKELLNQLLVELDAARFSRPSWFNPHAGICCGVADLVFEWEEEGKTTYEESDYADALLCNLMHDWPEHHRGASCYPVGDKNEYLRESELGTIWDNPRRIELLHWLIEETK